MHSGQQASLGFLIAQPGSVQLLYPKGGHARGLQTTERVPALHSQTLQSLSHTSFSFLRSPLGPAQPQSDTHKDSFIEGSVEVKRNSPSGQKHPSYVLLLMLMSGMSFKLQLLSKVVLH